MPSESVSTRSMVAPGYFASAAALTLAAVVPVRAVSPECPVVLDDLEVPVTASAVPVAAKTAPPPKPASTRALAEVPPDRGGILYRPFQEDRPSPRLAPGGRPTKSAS